MSKAHYFYFRAALSEIEKIVKDHQADFDHLLNDTFTESELVLHESKLDEIGAIFVQPIFSEMTFDDFYVSEQQEAAQKDFFESCRSSICLENLPDFRTNPFQVTYLIELLRNFDEVLVDQGGTQNLVFKKEYLAELKGLKNIFSLVPSFVPPVEARTTKPVDPIDFLIMDIYKELDRLSPEVIGQHLGGQSEKLLKAYDALKDERLDASMLLRKSGLNAKDFDDNLERLKFFLRRI